MLASILVFTTPPMGGPNILPMSRAWLLDRISFGLLTFLLLDFACLPFDIRGVDRIWFL